MAALQFESEPHEVGHAVDVPLQTYALHEGLPALPAGEVGGGVAPAILGTLEMLAIGAIIGVPVGMGTAIYLASAASAMVTGQTIVVDGGWLAR